MTIEDEHLLIKDLCARVPYGVKLNILENEYTDKTFNAIISSIDYCGEIKVRWFAEYEQVFSIEQIKPYLFPLSSMTEEQIKEVNKLQGLRVFPNPYIINWYLENHFDIYGLIPKGLALDATGLNILINKLIL